jgi:hypothetical protein
MGGAAIFVVLSPKKTSFSILDARIVDKTLLPAHTFSRVAPLKGSLPDLSQQSPPYIVAILYSLFRL